MAQGVSQYKARNHYYNKARNYAIISTPQLVKKKPANYPGTKLVGVKKENEKSMVVFARSPQNLEFGHFTFLSYRRRPRNLPNLKGKCRAIVFPQ